VSKFLKIIFFNSKKKKKNCKYLGVGQDLTEFSKIPMPESLNSFFKKIKIKIMIF
jgi:hypothetical protein